MMVLRLLCVKVWFKRIFGGRAKDAKKTEGKPSFPFTTFALYLQNMALLNFSVSLPGSRQTFVSG
jgi:hypothetical protein